MAKQIENEEIIVFSNFLHMGSNRNGLVGLPVTLDHFVKDRYKEDDIHASPMLYYLSRNTVIIGMFKTVESADDSWRYDTIAKTCFLVFENYQHNENEEDLKGNTLLDKPPKRPVDLGLLYSTVYDTMNPHHFNVLKVRRVNENFIERLYKRISPHTNEEQDKKIQEEEEDDGDGHAEPGTDYDLWGNRDSEKALPKTEGFVAIYESVYARQGLAKIPVYRFIKNVQKIPCFTNFFHVENLFDPPPNNSQQNQESKSTTSSEPPPINLDACSKKYDCYDIIEYLSSKSEFKNSNLRNIESRQIRTISAQWLFFSPYMMHVHLHRRYLTDGEINRAYLRVISGTIYTIHRALTKNILDYNGILPTFMDTIAYVPTSIVPRGKSELFLAYDNYLGLLTSRDSKMAEAFYRSKSSSIRPNLPKDFHPGFKKKRKIFKMMFNNFSGIYENERMNLGLNGWGKGNLDRLIRKSDNPFLVGESDNLSAYSEMSHESIASRLGGINNDKVQVLSKRNGILRSMVKKGSNSGGQLGKPSRNHTSKVNAIKLHLLRETDESMTFSDDDLHSFIDAVNRWTNLVNIREYCKMTDSALFVSTKNRTGGFVSTMNFISMFEQRIEHYEKQMYLTSINSGIVGAQRRICDRFNLFDVDTESLHNPWFWIGKLIHNIPDNLDDQDHTILENFYKRLVHSFNKPKIYPIFSFIVNNHDDHSCSSYKQGTHLTNDSYFGFNIHDWINRIPGIFRTMAVLFSTSSLKIIHKYGHSISSIYKTNIFVEGFCNLNDSLDGDHKNASSSKISLMTFFDDYCRHLKLVISLFSYLFTSLVFQKIRKSGRISVVGGFVHFSTHDIFEHFLSKTTIFDFFLSHCSSDYKIQAYFLIVFIVIEAANAVTVECFNLFKKEAKLIKEQFLDLSSLSNSLNDCFSGFNICKIVNIILNCNINDISNNASMFDISPFDKDTKSSSSSLELSKYESKLQASNPILIAELFEACCFEKESDGNNATNAPMDNSDIVANEDDNSINSNKPEFDVMEIAFQETQLFEPSSLFETTNKKLTLANTSSSGPIILVDAKSNIVMLPNKIEDFSLHQLWLMFNIPKYNNDQEHIRRCESNFYTIAKRAGLKQTTIDSFKQFLERTYWSKNILHLVVSSTEVYETCQNLKKFLFLFLKTLTLTSLEDMTKKWSQYIKVGYQSEFSCVNFCPSVKSWDNKDFQFYFKMFAGGIDNTIPKNGERNNLRNLIITNKYGGRKIAFENLALVIKQRTGTFAKFCILDIEDICKIGDKVFDGFKNGPIYFQHIVFDMMHTWNISECNGVFLAFTSGKFFDILRTEHIKPCLWFLSNSNTVKGFGYDIVRDLSRFTNISTSPDTLSQGVKTVLVKNSRSGNVKEKQIVCRTYFRSLYFTLSKTDETTSHHKRNIQWDNHKPKFIFVKTPNTSRKTTSSTNSKPKLELSYENMSDLIRKTISKVPRFDIPNREFTESCSLLHPKNLPKLVEFLVQYSGKKVLVVYGKFPTIQGDDDDNNDFEEKLKPIQKKTSFANTTSDTDDSNSNDDDDDDPLLEEKGKSTRTIDLPTFNKEKQKYQRELNTFTKTKIEICKTTHPNSDMISIYKWCLQKGCINHFKSDPNAEKLGGYQPTDDMGNIHQNNSKNRYDDRSISFNDSSYHAILFLAIDSYSKYEKDMCFMINRAIELSLYHIVFEATEEFVHSAYVASSLDDHDSKYNNQTTFFTSKGHKTSQLFETIMDLFPTKQQ